MKAQVVAPVFIWLTSPDMLGPSQDSPSWCSCSLHGRHFEYHPQSRSSTGSKGRDSSLTRSATVSGSPEPVAALYSGRAHTGCTVGPVLRQTAIGNPAMCHRREKAVDTLGVSTAPRAAVRYTGKESLYGEASKHCKPHARIFYADE
jgi:hypothetical protein